MSAKGIDSAGDGLSVLICVYHGDVAEYVTVALESLVVQTIPPTEVILVLDGPVNVAVEQVIHEYLNKLPITLVRLATNRGLRTALNMGLERCKFELVARMDADDKSLPCRLEKQAAFMKANPHVAVCSSWIEERESMDVPGQLKKLPTTHDQLLRFAKMRSPINHPAAMFRKSCVLKCGGYPEYFPEDYALWSVMMMNGMIFANIDKVLLHMRVGRNFISRRGRSFLIGELELIKFQREIGFLTFFQELRNVAMRIILRAAPASLKVFFYKALR